MSDTTPRDGDTMRHDDREAVSPTEAAARLGITPDAVRARLRRGTLPGQRVDNEWQVFLPPQPAPAEDTPSSDQHDTDTTHRVARHDNNTMRHDDDTMGAKALLEAKDETISRLDSEVAYLRDQLDHARHELSTERERFDVIHREALGRIEALTAGEEPQDAPVASPEPHHAADPPSEGDATVEQVWWRRWWRSLTEGA